MTTNTLNERGSTTSHNQHRGGRNGTGNQRSSHGRRGKITNKVNHHHHHHNNNIVADHPSQKNDGNNRSNNKQNVPCKFGIKCNRKNCKFLHAEPRLIDIKNNSEASPHSTVSASIPSSTQPLRAATTSTERSTGATTKTVETAFLIHSRTVMTVEELEAQYYHAQPSISPSTATTAVPTPPSMATMMTVEELEASMATMMTVEELEARQHHHQQQQQQHHQQQQRHPNNNGAVKNRKTKKIESNRIHVQPKTFPSPSLSSSSQTNNVDSKPIHGDFSLQHRNYDSSSSSDDEVIILNDDDTNGRMTSQNTPSSSTMMLLTQSVATKTAAMAQNSRPTKSKMKNQTQPSKNHHHHHRGRHHHQDHRSHSHEHQQHRENGGTNTNGGSNNGHNQPKNLVSTPIEEPSSSEDDEVIVVHDHTSTKMSTSSTCSNISTKNKNNHKGKKKNCNALQEVDDSNNRSNISSENNNNNNSTSDDDENKKALGNDESQMRQNRIGETATFTISSEMSTVDKTDSMKGDDPHRQQQQQQQQKKEKLVEDNDAKVKEELEKHTKEREEEEAAQKRRFQAELQRQREMAAKKKAEKKMKKAQKFKEDQRQKQTEEDARTEFWKTQINMERMAVNFVVRLSAAEFCRQNKGFNFTRDGVQHAGRDKLIVAAREAIYELYQNEIVTAVSIVGTNDGADGRHGTIKYWDEAKTQFCVAVDSNKGGAGSTKYQLKFFKPAHLTDRKEPPLQQKQQKQVKKKGRQTATDRKQHNITVHYFQIEGLVGGKDLDPISVDKPSLQQWLSSQSKDDPCAMDKFIDQLLADREAEEREAARMADQFKAEEEAAKKRRAEQRRRAQEAYEERRREYKAQKERFKEFKKKERRENSRRGHHPFGGGHGGGVRFSVDDEFFHFTFGGFGGGGFYYGFSDSYDDFFDDDDNDDYFDEQYGKVKQAELEAHADVLGVNVDAPKEVIVKQYRRLALQYHPDKYRPDIGISKDEAEEKFKEIQNAYDQLLSSLQDEDD